MTGAGSSFRPPSHAAAAVRPVGERVRAAARGALALADTLASAWLTTRRGASLDDLVARAEEGAYRRGLDRGFDRGVACGVTAGLAVGREWGRRLEAGRAVAERQQWRRLVRRAIREHTTG